MTDRNRPIAPAIRWWQSLTTVDADEIVGRDPVVILPLAATEQHGAHLPLSTDLDIALGLVGEAFRRLPPTVPAWVLPPQPLGVSREHARFTGTLSVEPDLVASLIEQVGEAIATAGVRRLILCNSHGGNRRALGEAALRLRDSRDMLVVEASWFQFPRPVNVEIPETEWQHGLHGGLVETAMMLHLYPDRVRQHEFEDARSLGQELQDALSHVAPEGAAPFAWLAGDLNPSGVTGNARIADARLGAKLVAHYGAVLAEVILDTKKFPLDRLT